MSYKNVKGPGTIPVVIIEFHDWMDLFFNRETWDEMGYRKFLKEFCIPVGQIKKIHKINIKPEDFPDNEWEP